VLARGCSANSASSANQRCRSNRNRGDTRRQLQATLTANPEYVTRREDHPLIHVYLCPSITWLTIPRVFWGWYIMIDDVRRRVSRRTTCLSIWCTYSPTNGARSKSRISRMHIAHRRFSASSGNLPHHQVFYLALLWSWYFCRAMGLLIGITWACVSSGISIQEIPIRNWLIDRQEPSTRWRIVE
jgi:hypothetical protein